MTIPPLFVIGGCTFVIALFVSHKNKQKRLPPGPRGWPIVGNILDIPKEYEWYFFGSLKEKYGWSLSRTFSDANISL